MSATSDAARYALGRPGRTEVTFATWITRSSGMFQGCDHPMAGVVQHADDDGQKPIHALRSFECRSGPKLLHLITTTTSGVEGNVRREEAKALAIWGLDGTAETRTKKRTDTRILRR